MAAELPTAHISHLQQARWFHTGGPWTLYRKRHDSLVLIWISTLISADPGTYPYMHTCCPEAGTGYVAKTPLDLGELKLRLNRRM